MEIKEEEDEEDDKIDDKIWGLDEDDNDSKFDGESLEEDNGLE